MDRQEIKTHNNLRLAKKWVQWLIEAFCFNQSVYLDSEVLLKRHMQIAANRLTTFNFKQKKQKD